MQTLHILFHVVHVSSHIFAMVDPSKNAFLMMNIRPATATGLVVVAITLKVERTTNDCLLLFPWLWGCARASAACGGSRGIGFVMHLVLISGPKGGDTRILLIKYNRAGQVAVAQNSNCSMGILPS
jgi:hypothetical protein